MRACLAAIMLAGCGSAPPRHDQVPSCGPRQTRELHVGESIVSDFGLRVTYAGASHDDYDDGRFDDLAQLVIERDGKRQPVSVSVYQTGPTQLLGTCVWAATGRDGTLISLAEVTRP